MNLSNWPADHCPTQAITNRLGELREIAKKRQIAAPLPVLDMKLFLPSKCKKVPSLIWAFAPVALVRVECSGR